MLYWYLKDTQILKDFSVAAQLQPPPLQGFDNWDLAETLRRHGNSTPGTGKRMKYEKARLLSKQNKQINADLYTVWCTVRTVCTVWWHCAPEWWDPRSMRSLPCSLGPGAKAADFTSRSTSRSTRHVKRNQVQRSSKIFKDLQRLNGTAITMIGFLQII